MRNQVDVGERVAGRRPRRGQQVHRLVVDVVAVAEVQPGQQGHVLNDEAKGAVRDVQTGQTQVQNVPQLTACVHLTCGNTCAPFTAHCVLLILETFCDERRQLLFVQCAITINETDLTEHE
ncbi:hypothetical protein MHYP_G00347430 [Metynnis hypsauchen]